MKLTNNEITILINYYDGLKFDEKMHVDDLKQTCTDLLDGGSIGYSTQTL